MSSKMVHTTSNDRSRWNRLLINLVSFFKIPCFPLKTGMTICKNWHLSGLTSSTTFHMFLKSDKFKVCRVRSCSGSSRRNTKLFRTEAKPCLMGRSPLEPGSNFKKRKLPNHVVVFKRWALWLGITSFHDLQDAFWDFESQDGGWVPKTWWNIGNTGSTPIITIFHGITTFGVYVYIYGTIYTVFRPTHFLYFLFVLNGKTPYQAWCKNCHDCSASEDLYKDGAAPTSQDLWSLSLTFVFLKVGDLLSLLHGRWQLRVTNVLIHLWMLEDYTGTSFKKPL